MSNKRNLSKLLEIGLCTAILFQFHHANSQSITINSNTEYQKISGFGGINNPGWIEDLTADQAEKAFGNAPGQMGLSILRVRIDGDSTRFKSELPTALIAKKYGTTIFASLWDPPAKMIDTVAGLKKLTPSMYGDYAQHLNAFNTFMKNNGAPLYAVSVQNEPDYGDWTRWTAEEIVKFLKENAKDIENKVMAPESFQFRRAFTDPILNDSAACTNVDIIGGHIYGAGLSDYPLARNKGKEVWMTEHLTGSESVEANTWALALDLGLEINDCMKANFNAYVWWYIRRFYGLITDDGNLSKKGYVMSHFAKFIRPGAIRVDAVVSSATNVSATAYKTDTSFVIVVVNKNAANVNLSFDIQNKALSQFTKITTSATKNLVNDGNIILTGSTFTASVDANSITTFTTFSQNTGKQSNIAPVSKAGEDKNMADEDKDGTVQIKLDGNLSSDVDGTIKNYSWSKNNKQFAWTSSLDIDLEIGNHIFVLTVTDNDGDQSSDTININISSLNNTNLWFEAECTIVSSNWIIKKDADVSNNNFLTAKTGTQSLAATDIKAEDILKYSFYITESGQYKLWARSKTPTANDDSYWVKMDDGIWYNWNGIPASAKWQWDDLHNMAPADVVTFTLDTGYHSISVCFREDGASLDKILLSNTGLIPTDKGEAASNCNNNALPVANAGPDQELIKTGSELVPVTLNGNGSTDSDGIIIAYSWSLKEKVIASKSDTTLKLGTGKHLAYLTVTDNYGAVAVDSVVINISADSYIQAEMNKSNGLINVYPNPFTNKLNISFSSGTTGSVQFEMFDLTGKQVYTSAKTTMINGENLTTIDMNHLEKGMYILKARFDNEKSNCYMLVKE